MGIEQDMFTYTTRIITKNGFNPVWKEQATFNIRFPEICFLIFKVYSKYLMKNIEIAQASVPLFCIRKGYRILDLFNSRLEQFSDTFLLLKINSD